MIRLLSILSLFFSILLLHNGEKVLAQSRTQQPQIVGTLQSVIVQNDGRVELRFTKLPKDYSSDLSADKKKLTIRMTDIGIDDRAREILAKGNVENVFVKTTAKGLAELYIILKARRGYSIEPLPYSDILAVNFFDWNTLPAQDNYYHSGLLAIESKTLPLAKEYFGKADQMNMGNASAMLGLTAIREGDAREAQRSFQRAITHRTTIADVFAGLADLYGAIGDTLSRNEYAQKFRERSGRQNYPHLVQFSIPPEALFIEPRSVAERLREEGFTDGQSASIDSAQRDSLLNAANRRSDSALNAMIQQQAQQLAKPQQNPIKDSTAMRSLAPSWLSTAVWGSLIGLIMLGIVGVWIIRRLISRKKKNASTLFTTDNTTTRTDSSTTSTFEKEELEALTELLAQEHLEAVRRTKQPSMPSAQEPTPEVKNNSAQPESPSAELPLRTANARNASQAYSQTSTKKTPTKNDLPKSNDPEVLRKQLGIDASANDAFEKLSGKAPLSISPADPTPTSSPATGRSDFFEPPDIAPDSTPGNLDELDDISRKLRLGRSEIEIALNVVRDPERSMDFKEIPLDSQEIPDNESQRRQVARELGVGKGELDIKKHLSPLDIPSPDNSRKKSKLSSLFSKPDTE